jgi:hypothetical protein
LPIGTLPNKPTPLSANTLQLGIRKPPRLLNLANVAARIGVALEKRSSCVQTEEHIDGAKQMPTFDLPPLPKVKCGVSVSPEHTFGRKLQQVIK